MSFNLKEYQKQYQRNRQKNKPKSYIDWLEKNKEKTRQYQKEYRDNNKERIAQHRRKYYDKNKPLIIIRERNRFRDKYKNDNEFKIKSVLRRRFLTAVGKNFKKGKAVDFLGCSISEFKEYIAKQFKEGMSWENHRVDVWHIDHIKPCASFDLTKEEEQRKCFHYTNMQPLWAYDNYSKGHKI